MKRLLMIALILVIVLASFTFFVACDTSNKSVKVIVEFPTYCGSHVKDEIETTKSSILNDGVLIDSVSYDNNTIFFFADNHSTLDLNFTGYEPTTSKVDGNNHIVSLKPLTNELKINAFAENTSLDNFNLSLTSLESYDEHTSYDLTSTDNTISLESGLYNFNVSSNGYTFKEENIYINESKTIDFYGFSNTFPLNVSAKTSSGEIIENVTFTSNELDNIVQSETINVDKTFSGSIKAESDLYDFIDSEQEFNVSNNELVFIGVKKKIEISVKATDIANNILNNYVITSPNASFVKQADGTFLANVDIDSVGTIKCALDNVNFEKDELTFNRDNTSLEFKATSFMYKFNINSDIAFTNDDISFFNNETQVYPIFKDNFYYINLPSFNEKIHIESSIFNADSDISFSSSHSTINLELKSYEVNISSLFEHKDNLSVFDNEKEIELNFDENNNLHFKKFITENGKLTINVIGFKPLTIEYSRENNSFCAILEKQTYSINVFFSNIDVISIEDFIPSTDYIIEDINENTFTLTYDDYNLEYITIQVDGYLPYTCSISKDINELVIQLEKEYIPHTEPDESGETDGNSETEEPEVPVEPTEPNESGEPDGNSETEEPEVPVEPDESEEIDENSETEEPEIPVEPVYNYYSVSGIIFVKKSFTEADIEKCFNDFLKANEDCFIDNYTFNYSVTLASTGEYFYTTTVNKFTHAIEFTIDKVKEGSILTFPSNYEITDGQIVSSSSGDHITGTSYVINNNITDIYFFVNNIIA